MLKNNLKRSLSDNCGNALIIALLAMTVSVLLAASFIYSTQNAAVAEAKVDANEQAYLVAKSGMVLFEDYLKTLEDDGKTADEIVSMYNSSSGYTATVGDGSMGTFTIFVNKNSESTSGYSITSIGQYADQQFKLYDYYEVEEDEDEDQDRDGEGAAPKAACITYNSDEVVYKGGVDGDIQQLSETGTISDSQLKGDLGTIYSVGSVNFDGDSSNCTVNAVFVKGLLTVGHSMTIRGETWAGELEKGSSTSNVTFNNDVHVQNDFNWNETGGDCTINGSLYVGGDATMKALTINGNVYVDGDLHLTQKTEITGDVYCGGHVYLAEESGAGVDIGGGIYAADGISFSSTNTNKFTVGGILFTYGRITESKGEFTTKSQYSVGGNGMFTAEELYTLCHATSDAQVAKGKVLDTLGTIASEIAEKLEKSLPDTRKPVTTVPNSLKVATSSTESVDVYNSWSDVPMVDGKYYVGKSCVFNFFVDLNNQSMIIKADGVDALGNSTSNDVVDIYFKKGVAVRNAGEATCTSNAHIYVDDTTHQDLIRWFLPQKSEIDAGGGMVLLYGKWAVEPVENSTRTVKTTVRDDYVPNLYVFSEDDKSNIADYGEAFGSEATNSCFPGYWLTPNVNIALGNNCAYKSGTEISKSGNNFPIIHGMLTTNMQTNQNGTGTIIVFHDPDVDKDTGMMKDGYSQGWSFKKATEDVYTYD